MFNSQFPAAAPLRVPRMVSLALLVVFGIVGMSVGINALAKFNDEKVKLRHAVPAGASVDVNTGDILNPGYVVTVVCGLLALFSFLFMLPGFLSGAYATRSHLRVQSAVLGFLTLWLFPTLVAFTNAFATHNAKISVTIGQYVLPDSIIQQAVQSLGGSTVYKHVDYLRLPAILPWVAFLFGLTSAVLTVVASGRAVVHSHTAPAAFPVATGKDMKEREKDEASVEQREIA